MQALVQACRGQSWPAEVAAVIASRPDAAGLDWARQQGIATAAPLPQGLPQPRGVRRRAGPGDRPPRARLRAAGRIHAGAHAGLRQSLRGPAGQYPSFAAAGVSRPAYAYAYACAGPGHRRARAWLHGAFRDARARPRPHHRAGLRAGAGGRYARGAGRARARGRTPGLSGGGALAGRRKGQPDRRPARRSRRAGARRPASHPDCGHSYRPGPARAWRGAAVDLSRRRRAVALAARVPWHGRARPRRTGPGGLRRAAPPASLSAVRRAGSGPRRAGWPSWAWRPR